MPTIVHEFAWPDRVVIGTIGEPGERTFYLQVRTGKQVVSVALEKQQSALLAEKIDEILEQLTQNAGTAFTIPAHTPLELVDNDPLEQPVDEQFRAGAMGLGWDPSTAQVVIEAYPVVENDEDTPDTVTDEPAEMLLVRIPVGTAQAFAMRTHEVVGAGRPICALCGTPIDAAGHVCVLPGDRE
jgi:uncharacterized repeat protein (TIGR03847 family)